MPERLQHDDHRQEDDREDCEQDREGDLVGRLLTVRALDEVIMRSRKVWPRSAVIRTTMRSDRTFVPPVTAERSPPDSRITGADSPVIADSSTDATPSMISPSDGIASPASQTTRSPLCEVRSGYPLFGAVREKTTSFGLRLASCAGCRPGPCLGPSAIASAKLANATVRNSQMVIDQVKIPGWAIASMRVTTLPMRTTNMTGFFTWSRGWNFFRASTRAWRSISRSNSPRDWATPCATVGVVATQMHVDPSPVLGWLPDAPVAVCCREVRSSEELSVAQLLDYRSERDGGEECEPTDDHDHSYQ